MNNFFIQITKSAELDLKTSRAWYNLQKYNLGEEFFEEFESVFVNVRTNPLRYPQRKMTVRRALLKRFPFSVYFIIEGKIIRIFAVLHNSRNPIIWQTRK
jgi:plasmid stabilization system protein ParE